MAAEPEGLTPAEARSVMLDADHSRVHVHVEGRDYCLVLIESRGGKLWIDEALTTVSEDREIGGLYDAIEAEIARQLDEDREAEGNHEAAAIAARITGCLNEGEV